MNNGLKINSGLLWSSWLAQVPLQSPKLLTRYSISSSLHCKFANHTRSLPQRVHTQPVTTLLTRSLSQCVHMQPVTTYPSFLLDNMVSSTVGLLTLCALLLAEQCTSGRLPTWCVISLANNVCSVTRRAVYNRWRALKGIFPVRAFFRGKTFCKLLFYLIICLIYLFYLFICLFIYLFIYFVY